MKNEKTVALITTELGKGWIVTNDALDYIDARGEGYNTAREAIKAAREEGYTHYRSNNRKDNNIHKL